MESIIGRFKSLGHAVICMFRVYTSQERGEQSFSQSSRFSSSSSSLDRNLHKTLDVGCIEKMSSLMGARISDTYLHFHGAGIYVNSIYYKLERTTTFMLRQGI